MVLPDGPPSLSGYGPASDQVGSESGASGQAREAQAESPASRPGLSVGRRKGSSEHEGIICKVLGGELLCARHQRERIHRSDGSVGLRV